MKTIAPTRSLIPIRAQELVDILAMEISYHVGPNCLEILNKNMIDVASEPHIANIMAEGSVRNCAELGTCTGGALLINYNNGQASCRHQRSFTATARRCSPATFSVSGTPRMVLPSSAVLVKHTGRTATLNVIIRHSSHGRQDLPRGDLPRRYTNMCSTRLLKRRFAKGSIKYMHRHCGFMDNDITPS